MSKVEEILRLGILGAGLALLLTIAIHDLVHLVRDHGGGAQTPKRNGRVVVRRRR
jgi:hypothetical protein